MAGTISKRHSERVYTGQNFGVTQISMPAGDQLSEHISTREAFLYVVSGTIRYCDAGGQHEMNAGDSQQIEAHSPHGVIAETDSVFLLVR